MSAGPHGRIARAALAVATATAAATAVSLMHGAPARAETIILPSSGSVQVTGNGNGHGHGLSQYGARGAAIAGLTPAQIVAFYYPGTTLATISGSTTIRVQISGATPDTCVLASSGLSVANVTGTLPVAGISRYRLAPSGTGLALQKSSGSCNGGTFTDVLTNLPAAADFSSTANVIRLFRSDGTSTDYHGRVGAVRSGSGEITVNRIGLDQYTQGVVPREMPASWQAAGVQAQAIAARTYAEYEREHASGAYDICDSTNCQVYGGATHYDASGNVLWQDDPAAVSGNAGQYLKYGSGAAFTQYSASNGGWTVDGGQPYLVAKADPYDNTGTGDPYIHWTKSVPVSQIASAYGLSRATQIQITQRDGHGEWGGRVLAANVVGVDSSGTSRTIATTGFGLQSAMGLLHNWFTVAGSTLPPSSPTLGGTIVHSTTTTATVFYNAGNDLRMRTWVNGSGWQPTVDLAAPAAGLTWDPDASTWGDGHIDVFARDGGGGLVNRSYSTGSGWSGWRSNGVTISSSPTVADPVPGECDVFWLGANHTLQTIRWVQGAGWSAPVAVPGVTNAASGPDATVLVTSKTLVVAYRGTNGQFWTVSRVGGTWQAPVQFNTTHALPATPGVLDPSVDNSGAETPNLYFTGTNGVVYHAAATTPWYAVPGAGTTSAPDAWTDLPTHSDLVSGHSGVFGTASWSRTAGWRTWMPVQ